MTTQDEVAPQPAEAAPASSDKKTLFVKNLPEDATKQQLELVFSEVGKLRHCFVVKKKRTEDSKGIGFVTFAEAEDAAAALKRTFKLGSNQLDVTVAEDKKKKQGDGVAKAKPKVSFTKEAKQARRLQKAKLIVRNLAFKATEADLEKKFGKFGKVLSVTIPKKDDDHVRGFAFVQFEKALDAAKAVKALNAKDILGRPVAVDFAVAKKKYEEVRKSKAASGKKDSKGAGDSGDEPSAYGSSDEDDEDDKEQSVKKQSRKCVKNDGKGKRPSKADEDSDDEDEVDEESESDDEASDEEEPMDDTSRGKSRVTKKPKKGETDSSDDEDSDEAEGDDSGSEVEFGSDGEVRLVRADEVKDKRRILGRLKSKGGSDEDMDSDSDDEDDDDESEGEDSDEEMDVDKDEETDEESPKKPAKKDTNKGGKKQDVKKDSDSDSDWGHTPNDDSSEDDDEQDKEKAKRKREMIKKEDLSRTVFVKNISFDTTQTTFQERMKQFGPFKFCLLCMDKMLDRPKGTGFVKFEERTDAAKCVESLMAGEVTLDGKVLSGSIAMKRDQLETEMQKKMDSKKQPKDKRNLYLAREGFIRAGTAVAARISDHDLKIRAKLEASKKKALKNLHNFVSDTRLCIHNLPASCDDKQLRRIFGRVVDRNAKILEARVMRNLKRVDNDGKGASKGFGFVKFERHEDALKALRAVNNNPTIFTDQMRPIVSFSIENRAALMVKERRLKNSRAKLQELRQQAKAAAEEEPGKGFDYDQGKRLPFEGLRAQVDVKTLPRRVGEKVRLDPKRRQHQLRLQRLAKEAKRKPEFRKKKEKRPKGPTKAQQKERLDEKRLNQMIELHRRKMQKYRPDE